MTIHAVLRAKRLGFAAFVCGMFLAAAQSSRSDEAAEPRAKTSADGEYQALRVRYYKALDACTVLIASVSNAEAADGVLAEMLTAAPVGYVQEYLKQRSEGGAEAREKAACRILLARIRELQTLFDEQAVREQIETAVRQRRVDTLCTCLLVRPRGALPRAAAQALAEFPGRKSVRSLMRALQANAGGVGYGGSAALVEQIELARAAIASLGAITGIELRLPDEPGRLARGGAASDEDQYRSQLIGFRKQNTARCQAAIAAAKEWLEKHPAPQSERAAE
jgi:hypothetical protein